MKTGLHSGVVATLTAAVLFGAGTPLAKVLLTHTGPWLLAALLYLGSGVGLWVLRRIRRSPTVYLARGDWGWLAGAIVVGGMVGPGLLMLGLSAMPASGASLLLNAEGVLTALLAWFALGEFRPPHCVGHVRHRRRSVGAEVAAGSSFFRSVACAGGGGRLSRLGHR